MLTTAPWWRSSIPCRAAVVRYTGAKKVTAIRRSTSSAVVLAALRWMLMPALLTRMSTRPKRSSTVLMTRSHSAREEMSAGTDIDATAFCRQRSTTSSRRSLRRATAATVAPRRARSAATVAPIPDDAPVTTATRPAMSIARFLPEGRERVHAGRRRLFRAARAEEDALPDDDHARIAGCRQRDGVDQGAGTGVPDLHRPGDPGPDEGHAPRKRGRAEGLRPVPLPLDGPAGGVEGVDARLLDEAVVGIAGLAAQGPETFEAAEVPQSGGACDALAVVGRGADEASCQSAEDHVGRPLALPGGGVDRVVGAVLAADAEEGLSVGIGGGAEVPVTAVVDALRIEDPRQRAVIGMQSEDLLVVHALSGGVADVAVGHVEHDDVLALDEAGRGPHAAASVVEDGAVRVDRRLEAPDLAAVLDIGGCGVPAMAALAVGRHAEDHVVADHDRRREDARLVLRRVGWLFGEAGVVVVPDLLAGVGVEGVQRVPAAEDDQVPAVRLVAGRLVPRRGGDQSAVRREEGLRIRGVHHPSVGSLLGTHRRLGLDRELPGLGACGLVDGVEVPVPR